MTGFKKGAFFSVSFGVVGKVFSFLSSLLLAFLFGSSIKADIYFYLLLLTTLLNTWLYGINFYLVVPEFMHRYQKDKKTAIDFANFFINIYVLIGLLIIIGTCLFPWTILSVISDFGIDQINQGISLVMLGSAHFVLFFIMSFLINLCESFQLFKIYFFVPLNTLLPLIILFFTRNIEAMFIGYITAEIIQISICLYLLKTRGDWFYSFKKLKLSDKFKKDFWAMQPNSFINMLLGYVPLWLISGMQAGLVSAINYARMISDSPSDVITTKVGNVVRIKFTKEAASGKKEELKESLFKTDRFLVFILIPLSVFTSVFAKDIVEMLFMRGHFNLQDVSNTSFFLTFFILCVPFSALNSNFSLLLSSLQLLKESFLKYAGINLIFIGCFVWGIKNYTSFSYPVILLSVVALTTIFNFVIAKKLLPFLNYTKHALKIIGLLISSLLLAFIIKSLNLYQGNIFIKIFINGITFVALQLFLFYKLGFVKQIREDFNV